MVRALADLSVGRLLRFLRRRRALLAGALLALLSGPLTLHAALTPVRFNQFWIAGAELRHGTLTFETAADTLGSAYASGIDIALRRPGRAAPPFGQPLEVFSWIWSWAPPRAVVYPTEGFYYFRTEIDGKPVTGNLRIADLPKGRISFAYFVEGDADHAVLGEITAEEGLSVVETSDRLYAATFRGKTVRFRLPETWRTPPRELRLLPEERFIAQIHDESGIRLFLLYNEATKSFYEVLNEEEGVAETLREIEPGFWLGGRTGFLYWNDPESDRKLFLGCDLAHGQANDYYDGPGDQVPFRADLRPILNIAYPSTLLGDGVDPHGVWLGKKEWCRYVIDPFSPYAEPEVLIRRAKLCDFRAGKSELWTQLTKPWWYSRRWIREIRERLEAEGKAFPVEAPERTLRFAVDDPEGPPGP